MPRDDAVKVVTDIRDNYIREHCQTFNDGHWVGTPEQQEYVSHIDDVIEALKVLVTTGVAIEDAKPKGAIYSRAECIFNYCPNPDGCREACASPRSTQ